MLNPIDYIPIGKNNAISSQELTAHCGFKNVRELQHAVEANRNAGAVICSSHSGGYYIHSDIHELREYVRTQESRGKNTLRSLRSAKQALRRLENNE